MNFIKKKIAATSKETWMAIFLVIFYGLGILGLGITHSREFFLSVMPYSLLLVMVMLFSVHKSWQFKHVLAFLVIAILGFGVEMIGVLTGHVFGDYEYGRALGFKVMQTPPLIGLNWVMLIYCVYEITLKLVLPVVLRIIFGSILMVFYDIIMEPVAIQINMWSWAGSTIPIQNYFAWFVISFVMLSILYLARINYRNRFAPKLLFIQIGLFIALNLILGW